MNVLIACNSGVSTSILSTRMKAICNPGDMVVACQYNQVANLAQHFDVILLAPQIGSFRESVERICSEAAVGVIDGCSYGKLDGASVLAYASELAQATTRSCEKDTGTLGRRTV